MRQRLFLGTLAVAVLASVATSATASNLTRGADIFGVGGGHLIDNRIGTFDISAHAGNGREFGHVGLKIDENELSGQVIDLSVDINCVSVQEISPFGGRGAVSGVVKRVSPVPNFLDLEPGDEQAFLISDTGEPSSGPVDAFHPVLGTVQSCKLLSTFFFLPNVTEGNITIRVG